MPATCRSVRRKRSRRSSLRNCSTSMCFRPNASTALPCRSCVSKDAASWCGCHRAAHAAGTPPYLSPYFAAKAAMDSLAVSCAAELTRWGIETSIIVPGAFTKGTNHFTHSGSPADKDRAKEYDEGPYAGLPEQSLKGLASLEPADADV